MVIQTSSRVYPAADITTAFTESTDGKGNGMWEHKNSRSKAMKKWRTENRIEKNRSFPTKKEQKRAKTEELN